MILNEPSLRRTNLEKPLGEKLHNYLIMLHNSHINNKWLVSTMLFSRSKKADFLGGKRNPFYFELKILQRKRISLIDVPLKYPKQMEKFRELWLVGESGYPDKGFDE